MIPPGGGYGAAKAGGMLPPSLSRQSPYDANPQVNIDGLPVRPGKEQCLVYLNTGACNNGISCIFDHPRTGRPSSKATDNAVSGALPKGGGAPPMPAQQPAAGGMSPDMPPARPPVASPSAFGAGLVPTASAGVPVKQGGPMPTSVVPQRPMAAPAPSSPPGVGAPTPALAPASGGPPPGMPPAAAPSSSPSVGFGRGGSSEAAKVADERMEGAEPDVEYNDIGLPIRPGMQKCGFYLRSGQCNYGPTCRFDHPAGLGGIMAGPSGFGNLPLMVGGATTNEAGMARRPGKEQCPFLARTGSCPHGPECRFDHASGGETSAMHKPSLQTGRKDRGLGGSRGRRPVASSTGFRRP